MRTSSGPRMATSAILLATGLVACGGQTSGSIVDKAASEKKLVIGIKYDQPGLGVKKPDGTVEGLDVDIAKYVAKELGVAEKDITWVETRSANREPFIQQGQVDLVFASYSITVDRKKKVTFGGPYYVAHQDILVRAGDTSITGVEDLAGKTLCSVSGSVSAKRITDEQHVKAKVQEVGGWAECVTRLLGGQVDAVSSDDTVLAGFAAQQPGTMRIVGKNFSDERYGVGMRLDDKKGCEAVDRAIQKMFATGAAQEMMRLRFGAANFKFDAKQPRPEGCG
ncbi:glutamate ABC transporter substrate-binding protein [Sphaerisporangium corydalis]|uniref:Glutamate ABC transporter substrate-binding protein n=1 Tax=Sphaerisporangium corydalis TaxID=1441875 RepID=A0ABV9ETD2_9ACTN|nr:glutamate ABC transporter substrate-binding protein [Sphaerisporangium corydalis]